ncbi:hypothetical protein [Paenibacillus sp. NEAU-GSW1]|uniref:hypothetical protein n=1 Tax=Paenibacillus sp. NEAU-GSW1 TaxID=2682486 RepID=UPI0012E15C2C|nr:hypothetical protein [Paenibacillus sp. NEAU-GSW1]MUT65129.1 hypothetical protein [Paenibacillus sp. NEAU-GSW1]
MNGWRMTAAAATLLCFVLYLSPVLAYALQLEEAPLGYLWSLLFAVCGIVLADLRLEIPLGLRGIVYVGVTVMHVGFAVLFALHLADAGTGRWLQSCIYLICHLVAVAALAGFAVAHKGKGKASL